MRILRRHPRGGTFLAWALERLGVRHVISLPGSQMLAVWDAIGTRSGLQLIVPRSESVGAMMANGYGLSSGRPCVVMNTLGPGVGNELSALHDASLGESPIVFVCPAHPREKCDHLETVFQGFDQAAFLAPYAKDTLRVDEAAELGAALETAVARSLVRPMGPVRVDVSYPLLFERHDFGGLPSLREAPTPKRRTIVVADATRELGPYLDTACAADRLWPAAGGDDDAVPFAVGSALAHDGPTALTTTLDVLVRNVHALSLSNRNTPRITLVSTESSSATAVAQLARSIGAVHLTWDPRSPVQPGPGQLTIVAIQG